MRKNIFVSFLLIAALLILASCSSLTKFQEVPDIGIVKPEPEPLGPLETQVDFEEVVTGKVWYTKLQGDENLDKIYQSKLQFNTTSKTFTKETFYWEKYGRTNTYKYAGSNMQKAEYQYGLTDHSIEYTLISDYNVNASSSRINNKLTEEPKTAFYLVENDEIIIWDEEKYYSKPAMENYSIGNFTNQREFSLN